MATKQSDTAEKETKTYKPGSICPRCRAEKIAVHSHSPVRNVWTVYGCRVCLYAWRDTEPEVNTNPDKYPEVFRIKPEDIPNYPVMPTVPPLLKPQSGA